MQMLGRGRPFVVELIEPDARVDVSSIDLNKIAAQTAELSSDLVTVKDLQWVKRSEVNAMRNEETEKKKKYSALCCASRPMSQAELDEFNSRMKPFAIEQKTPLRVLHRRPLATRKRTIESLALRREPGRDDRYFSMDVISEAGTYIKELVHSDFGRTKPSLGDLIGDCQTDIISLDVVEVFVDWPPSIE